MTHGESGSHETKPYGPAPGVTQCSRLWGVVGVSCILFLVIAARLVQVHAFPEPERLAQSQRNIGRRPLHESRGDILDANNTLLATDRQLQSLWADPTRIEDPLRLAQRISVTLRMHEEDVYDRLTRRDSQGRLRRGVPVRRWLSEAESEELRDLVGAAGRALWYQDEPTRYYPHGELAAHVLGFVNREHVGGAGIEGRFDPYLRSVPGELVSRVDVNRTLLHSLTLETRPPEGGDAVHLTLDARIQHILEQELDKALEMASAKRAMGMVMDPHTGAIRAMATRPSYNPNQFSQYTAEERTNPLTVHTFEPGSVFKIVAASAALEHGIVTPETLIDCEDGGFNPYGHYIRDFYALGVVPFYEAYAQSSNVALIKLAAELGPERLEAWIRRFGFGEPSSRDFPAEEPGRFRPVEQWSRYSMGSLPMGQEISVTVPQLARAFSVIANGGFLVRPYIVESATNRDGETTYQHEPEPPQRILSAHTAEVMQALSHIVVTEGTGRRASMEQYRAGGKTGTAQMARLDGPGYDPNRFMATFGGFAPIARPELVTVIVVQEPGISQRYGGYICGPVFKEVMRESLAMLQVPEDPVLKPVDVAELEEEPELPNPPPPEDSGDYSIRPLDSLQLVELETDLMTVGPRLPDFEGKTKREAQAQLASLEVQWSMSGAGWVTEQDPAPGTPLGEVDVCRLVFANREPPVTDEDDEAEDAVPPSGL